jgi:histone H3/H4
MRIGGDLMALVVRSKVKGVVKGMRFSGDFFDAMDKAVMNMVKAAAERAKKNGRATVRPVDL